MRWHHRIIKAGRFAGSMLALPWIDRLILSAGMPRSGSTLLFNIIRQALESAETRPVIGCWIDDFPTTCWSAIGKTCVVKTHVITRPHARLLRWRHGPIIYSFRDLRDAMVSTHRKFKVEPTLNMAQSFMREYHAAKRHADLIIRYEELIDNLPSHIHQIANLLNVEVDVQAIAEQVALPTGQTPHPGNTTNDGTDYDPGTLLHANHATGTQSGDWRTIFSPALQQEIHRRFGQWFVENGYPPK